MIPRAILLRTVSVVSFGLTGAACRRAEPPPGASNSSTAQAHVVASDAPGPGEPEPAAAGDAERAMNDGGDAGATKVTTNSSELLTQDAAPPPPDMLLVPGGSFTMGTDTGGQEDEHPAHTVTLLPFYLDATEVTNAEWEQCVAAQSCRPKSEAVRSKHPDFDGPAQPVTGISWDDARAYCLWRGKRLPREAEFERAVRGTDDRRFPWGNDPPTHDKTVFASARPENVATHPGGRGPYGHDDLAGNAWEWMQDEYDPYAYRRQGASEGKPGSCSEIMAALDELRRKGKQGFTGANPIPEECEHSIRGGAYNYDADGLRATNRVHHPGRFRIPMLGVRCAKDGPP